MVAGMLMPLDNLRAIYERLFRDGVMVAKKDKRPQTNHPEIPGVGNFQVIRAMGSLKSKGFVRETFAWRHFYWYLTNEGIVYLRDYLHLPSEIVPTPLQRVRRPAATLSIVQRATRVQAVEGPTSYVPKPRMVGAESPEALKERQGYRHKRMQTDEESVPNEKTSRFRGRAISVDYNKSRSPGQSMDQAQSMYQGGEDHSFRKKITTISHQPPAKFSSETSLVQKMSESYKRTSEASLLKNTTTMVNVDLPAQIALTAETVEIAASMPNDKAGKAKEEVCAKTSPDMISTKTAKDTYISSNVKEEVEQTLKVTKARNTQEHTVKEKMTENMQSSIFTTSYTPQPGVVKPRTKASQETIISVTSNDAYQVSSSSKEQMKKSLRVTEIKNIEEHPVKEVIHKNTETRQELEPSKSPKDVSLSSHSKMLVEKTLKVTQTQNSMENPVEEKIIKKTETSVSILSTTTATPQPVEHKPVIKVSQELISTISANGASVPPSKKHVKVAETKNEQEHPIKDEMLKNTNICISTTTSIIETVELKAKSKASQDLIIGEPAKETSVPLSSTEQVDKTVKVTKTKNIQKHPAKNEMNKNTETSLSLSSTFTSQPVELKTKTTQELDTGEPPKGAPVSPQSKKQEGKPVKVTKSKSSQDEMPQNKEACISMSASIVQELMPPTKVAPDLNKSTNVKEIKMEDDTDKTSGSAVSCVPKSNEDTTVVNDVVDFVIEKAEVCLVQQTLEEHTNNVGTQSAVPPPTGNVQKCKKSKKTSSIKETKGTQLTLQESVTTDMRTESKTIKHGTNPVPEISDATAVEQVKEFIVHKEIKVVEQTATKEVGKITKQEVTSVQQTPPPIKLLEESKAKDSEQKDSEAAPKSSKRRKKKQHAADNHAPSSAAEISATEEIVTAQVEIKMHPQQGSEPFAVCESPKICSDEGSQTAAVQSEAPVHKGEVEPAQPSAEKIKREVLKGKTSSSHQLREAPTAQASAAASAQAGPYPEHGEPPSVAQHSASPDTQCKREKKNVLSVSKAVKQPVTTGSLSVEEKQVLSEDEAAMRKKIVVVEEVIEVQQQIPTPSADGSQLPVPPVPEIPGEDLDYDVLEELAKDHTVFQSPVKEVVWDHSLLEPEPKTFPNFIEGMVKTESLLSCVCNVLATNRVPLCLQRGRVSVVIMQLS